MRDLAVSLQVCIRLGYKVCSVLCPVILLFGCVIGLPKGCVVVSQSLKRVWG